MTDRSSPDIVERLEAAYQKVSFYPETRTDGLMDLLALRNLIPEAVAALRNVAQTAPKHDHRVYFGCECCEEHAPENGVNCREDIGVMPDGTWLCDGCYSDCDKSAYGLIANDVDDFEFPRFEDLPRPAVYPIPSTERACTCHPDERLIKCQHKYSFSECLISYLISQVWQQMTNAPTKEALAATLSSKEEAVFCPFCDEKEMCHDCQEYWHRKEGRK